MFDPHVHSSNWLCNVDTETDRTEADTFCVFSQITDLVACGDKVRGQSPFLFLLCNLQTGYTSRQVPFLKILEILSPQQQ